MSNEQHVTDLLPAYALDALDADEAAQVEAHLPDCAACQAELHTLEAITNELPLALAGVDPPPALRHKLMARIEPETPQPATAVAQQPTFWGQIIAVFHQHKALAYSQLALFVLVIILLTSTLLLWQQVNELSIGPQAGRLQAVRLHSTGVVAGADGFMTVSGDGLSGALVLDRVPQLPEDQRYQLWLVKENGERASAALLAVDELEYGGGRVRAPESLFNYVRAEVTIETAEGSSQPTSEVILSAPLFPE